MGSFCKAPKKLMTSSTVDRAVVAIAVVLGLLLVTGVEDAEAKRGCSSFGHSCFGGHGKKRSDELYDKSMNIDNPTVDLPDWDSRLAEGPDTNLSKESVNQIQQLYKLSPYLKRWLKAYRDAIEKQPSTENE